MHIFFNLQRLILDIYLATPADFFIIRKVLNSKFIKCSSSKAAQNSLNFVDTFTRTKVTAV